MKPAEHPDGRCRPPVAVHPQASEGPQGGADLAITVANQSLTLHVGSLREARRDAARLARRLARLLPSYTSLGSLAWVERPDHALLTCQGHAFWVVTPRMLQTTRQAMSEPLSEWNAALKKQASKPTWPVHLAATIELPTGSTQLIALPTFWHKAVVQTSAEASAQVKLSSSGGCLQVKSLQPASVEVLLLQKGKQKRLTLEFLESAGPLPARLETELSGGFDDTDFTDEVLSHTLHNATANHRGATASPLFVHHTPKFHKASVWLEGPGLWPTVRGIEFALEAGKAHLQEPEALAASNQPEVLVEDGKLLDQQLLPVASTYYYHHQNARGASPRLLEVYLQNTSDQPSRVLLTHSGAGPSADELYAGHLATYRALGWKLQDQAWVVHLAPHARYVLDARVLPPHTLACGVGQVQTLAGKAPRLVVEASTSQLTDADESASAEASAAESRHVRARGLFAKPRVDLTASYRVGDAYTFVPIGAPPYQQPQGPGSPNIGNYGVEHHVHLNLENPGAGPTRVFVVLAVGGGAARGSLRVDGQLVETPVLSPKRQDRRESGIASYELAPGQKKAVELLIVPEPGSNYPVRLIVKPLPANQ